MMLRTKIKLKNSLKKILIKFKNSYKLALATGANRLAAMDTVTTFGLNEYFDYIIAGDEVKEAKPDPEIFLKAAQGLNLKPEECVVIEDSRNGLLAAKAASMHCVVTTNGYTEDENFSEADIVVSELGDPPKVQVCLETLKNVVS